MMSLLNQGKGGISEDLEGDELPPAPNQDLERNSVFQEHVVQQAV